MTTFLIVAGTVLATLLVIVGGIALLTVSFIGKNLNR
jgi:hypothetical protein